MSGHVRLLLLVSLAIGSLVALPTSAQESVPTSPQNVEPVAPVGPPIVIRGEDLDEIMARLRARPPSEISLPPEPGPANSPQPSASAEQVFALPPPQVVNHTNRFIFQDATSRDGNLDNPVPPVGGGAGIESLRQSLVGKGSR